MDARHVRCLRCRLRLGASTCAAASINSLPCSSTAPPPLSMLRCADAFATIQRQCGAVPRQHQVPSSILLAATAGTVIAAACTVAHTKATRYKLGSRARPADTVLQEPCTSVHARQSQPLHSMCTGTGAASTIQTLHAVFMASGHQRWDSWLEEASSPSGCEAWLVHLPLPRFCAVLLLIPAHGDAPVPPVHT